MLQANLLLKYCGFAIDFGAGQDPPCEEAADTERAVRFHHATIKSKGPPASMCACGKRQATSGLHSTEACSRGVAAEMFLYGWSAQCPSESVDASLPAPAFQLSTKAHCLALTFAHVVTMLHTAAGVFATRLARQRAHYALDIAVPTHGRRSS